MKKVIYTFLLIFLCQMSVFAQSEMEFAPVGAKWWYIIEEFDNLYNTEQEYIRNSRPRSVTVIKDSVANIQWIDTNQFSDPISEAYPRNDTLLTNQIIKVFEVCDYKDGDLETATECYNNYTTNISDGTFQLYLNEDNEFVISEKRLLFDSSFQVCNIGESKEWEVSCTPNDSWGHGISLYDCDSILVDNIHLKQHSFINHTTSNFTSVYGDKITEKLGFNKFLFICNEFINSSLFSGNIYLSCYEDNFINYHGFPEQDCYFFNTDTVTASIYVTGIDSKVDQGINIHPTLLKESSIQQLALTNITSLRVDINIIDVSGNTIVQQRQIHGDNILKTNLKAGIYIIQILNNNKIIKSTKIYVK